MSVHKTLTVLTSLGFVLEAADMMLFQEATIAPIIPRPILPVEQAAPILLFIAAVLAAQALHLYKMAVRE